MITKTKFNQAPLNKIKVENIDHIEDELINSDSKIFLEQLKKLQKTKYNDFDKILELFKT